MGMEAAKALQLQTTAGCTKQDCSRIYKNQQSKKTSELDPLSQYLKDINSIIRILYYFQVDLVNLIN